MHCLNETQRCELVKNVLLAESPPSDLFSLFDKKIVTSGTWSRLIPTSRSVYPVISRHFNSAGVCWPGRETIAKLSGVAKNHISIATADIEKNGLLKISKGKLTARGQRPNIYHATTIPTGSDSVFLFHNLIDGLHWSKLTDSARSLYISMRCFGFLEHEHVVSLTQECFDGLDDEDGESLMNIQELVSENFREFYATRPFELCIADEKELKKLSGVKDSRTHRKALRSLSENGVIRSLGDFIEDSHTWAVAVHNVFPKESAQ